MKKIILLISLLLQPVLVNAQELDDQTQKNNLIEEIISYKDKSFFHDCFVEYPNIIKDFESKQNKKEIYQKKYLKKLSLQELNAIKNERQFQFNIETKTKEFFEKEEPITCTRLYSDFFISINAEIFKWLNKRHDNHEISTATFLKETDNFQIRTTRILEENMMRSVTNDKACIFESRKIQYETWRFLNKNFGKKFKLKHRDNNWVKKGCGFNMTTLKLIMDKFENQ